MKTQLATTLLDTAGAVLLVVFAAMVWAPLALLVAGVACLAMSWSMSRGGQ